MNVRRGILGLTLIIGIAIIALYFQDRHFWHRYYLLTTNDGILPAEGWAGSEYDVVGAERARFELAPASVRTITTEALEQVSAYAGERNSYSLVVWHQGNLLWEEYFQEYDADTLVVGKSMAKMVLGVVIARAIEEGHIASLDEPAATYIKEWQGTDKAAITVRHLLHMAAGFEPFYTMSYNPFGNFMRSYIAGHNERTLIDGYDLIDEPGTQYDYSQAVSDLLGLVLERAVGMPYGQYLGQSLLKPIGAPGGQVMMNRPDGLAHTGCCLLLPSESWLRVGILLANGGQVAGENLFPTGWMKDYLAPSPANPAMGLHIWLGEPYLERRSWSEVGEPKGFGVLHSEPYLASDLFLFDGNAHQVVYIVPSENLVVMRTGGWTFSTGKEWDNAYIPNTLIRGMTARP
ncbi:MAG: serine hydrolase domain-containing protein [Gammaproteobacteria bacterium]